MKKLIVIALVLLVAFSAIAAVSEGRKVPVPILLKSRQIAESRTPLPFSLSGFSKGYYIVQFDHVLTDEEKKNLSDAGIKLFDYIPENAWLAWVESPDVLKNFGAIFFEKLRPEDKISPQVNFDGGEKTITVVFFENVGDDVSANILEKYSRIVKKENERFFVEIKPELIKALASEDSVKWIEPEPPEKMILNDGSRSVAGVDAVQTSPYNLTGTGVVLGIWDNGLANHSDFNSRRIIGDNVDQAIHATHVTGTVAGDGNLSEFSGGTALQWRGMAPNATIVSYDYYGDLYAETNNSVANKSNMLSQNSWGWDVHSNCTQLGEYDSDSRTYDKMVRGANIVKPVIIVFAAGNERSGSSPYCGSQGYGTYNTTLPPGGTAKNTITVGAVDKSSNMASYSSWGPTDDGRIKPDVVAVGSSVVSTHPMVPYSTLSGTSMAAPAVSGIIGLMVEAYRNTHSGANITPSTAKAVLIHTATDMSNTGPDYTSGWGIVNATKAVDKIRQDVNGTDVILEGNITTGGSQTYFMNVPSGQAEMKITLVWSDYEGSALASVELVNNLDLLVYNSTNDRFYPWTLNVSNPSASAVRTADDNINNAEQVYVSNPNNGTWRIVINGTSVSQSPQSYSLVTDFEAGGPIVELNSPADGFVSSANNITFNCSASDVTGLSNITLYTNTTGAWSPNSTTNISGTSNSSAWNLTINEGTYIWNCLAYDNTSNSGWGSANRTFTVAVPPAWSNNQTNITAVYSSSLSFFNITWTDNTAVSSVLFESNFSSSPANYTMQNISNVYMFNATLPAGSFYWKSYANDTSGNRNSTGTWTFTINRANSTLTLLLNGTQGNYSINESRTANITVYAQSAANITLYVNGTVYQTGSSPLQNISNLTQPGLYNITAVLDSNQNYTWNRTTYWLEVNDTTAPSITGASLAATILISGENATVSANATDNTAVAFVWYNVSNSTFSSFAGMANISNAYSFNATFNTTNLSIGSYNVTVFANDTAGNIGNSSAGQLIISAAANLSFAFRDRQSQPVNVTFEIRYRDSNSVRNQSSNISSLNSIVPDGGLWNIIVRSLFNISITANITGNTNTSITMDSNISEENISSTGIRVFVEAVAVETGLNFSNATVTFSYNDSLFVSENRSVVLACHQWNMTNRSCNSSWANVTANSTIDKTSNVVSINTTNFSAFALAENYSCGDGLVDTGEQCDSSNLSGQTCVSRGYVGGTLACSASCTFDTGSCTSGGGTTTTGGGGGGGGAVVNATKNATVSVAKVCTENEKKCTGNDSYICSNNTWKISESCAYGCENGICKEKPKICVVDELRCNDNILEVCSDETEWEEKEICDYRCENNTCIEKPVAPVGAFFGMPDEQAITLVSVVSVVAIIVAIIHIKTKKVQARKKKGKPKKAFIKNKRDSEAP